MSFILVFANDSGCRRLYVDNLVMRGYVAVGSASTNEARTLLQYQTPELIIVCAIRTGQEETIVELRNISALDNVPIVLVCPDPPDYQWMKAWNVTGLLPYPMDLRRLLQNLRPWLRPLPEYRNTTNDTSESSHAYELRRQIRNLTA